MTTRIKYHESSFAHGGVVHGYARYERDCCDLATCDPHPQGTATHDPRSNDHDLRPRVPLILLHGFAQSAASWDELARELTFSNPSIGAVYALDFVGHGLSDHPENPSSYSMDAVCETLRAFVNWVVRREGERPVLVGYSMGGRIAIEALVRYGAQPRVDARPVGGSAAGVRVSGANPAAGDNRAAGANPAAGDNRVSTGMNLALVGRSVASGLAAGRAVIGGVASHVARFGLANKAVKGDAYHASRAFANDDDALAISGLVLESAGFGPADESARQTLKSRNEAWAAQVREQGVEAFMRYWQELPLFESQASLPAEKRASVWAGRLANRAESLALTFEGTGQHAQSSQAESLVALLGAGDLPFLYVAGALDTKYSAFGERLVAARAEAQAGVQGAAQAGAQVDAQDAAQDDARVDARIGAQDDARRGASFGGSEDEPRLCVVVEGAGHNVHLERPDAFARELAALVARI